MTWREATRRPGWNQTAAAACRQRSLDGRAAHNSGDHSTRGGSAQDAPAAARRQTGSRGRLGVNDTDILRPWRRGRLGAESAKTGGTRLKAGSVATAEVLVRHNRAGGGSERHRPWAAQEAVVLHSSGRSGPAAAAWSRAAEVGRGVEDGDGSETTGAYAR